MQNRSKEKTSKPPQIILDLIEQVKQIRLYLLKTIRPTILIYCDDKGNQFKVELSTNMICSCNQNKQHCIHTIYTLLNVYHVNEQCSIIWQQQYSTFDIYKIINGYYKTMSQQIKKKQQIHVNKQQQQNNNYDNIYFSNTQQIQMDDICPICYENFLDNEAMVNCGKQCENNFHSKCLKIWINKQKSNHLKNINCPMCRVDWSDTALNEISQIEQEFINLNKTHNILCNFCRISPIFGTLYTCISCPNYHLCFKCYKKKQHISKHIFMFKYFKFDQQQFEFNLTFQSLYKLFPEHFNFDDPETKELILMDTWFNKKIKCSFCQEENQLRLLKCGHFADENCINRMKEHYYICPIDYKPQFIGLYNNLTEEQRKFHLTETKMWIVQQDVEQNINLFRLRQSMQTRPKQLSQYHFINSNNKQIKNQQYTMRRYLSTHKSQYENPSFFKSVRSNRDFI